MINNYRRSQNRVDLFFAALFSLFGLLLGVFSSLWKFSMLDTTGQDLNAYVVASCIQYGVFAFAAGFFGMKTARMAGMGSQIFTGMVTRDWSKYRFSVSGLIAAIVIALVTGFISATADRFVFVHLIDSMVVKPYAFDLNYLMTSLLSNGILEEVMLRLLIVSLFAWAIAKFVNTKHGTPKAVYWVSIILCAVLYPCVSLPAAQQVFGLSWPVVLRCFVLNGGMGFFFGWLYWKKGLEYAIISHILSVLISQLIFLPMIG